MYRNNKDTQFKSVILFRHGKSDWDAKYEDDHDHYESLIPQPNVVRLNGIGHYPQLEAPQAVLEHFISFIGSNKNI